MEQPLRVAQAKKLLRKILKDGEVSYSLPHAMDMLRKRNLLPVDCENVLRGGVVDEAEWENGGWRHKVRTPKIEVIIQFLSQDELMVITAWRNR